MYNNNNFPYGVQGQGFAHSGGLDPITESELQQRRGGGYMVPQRAGGQQQFNQWQHRGGGNQQYNNYGGQHESYNMMGRGTGGFHQQQAMYNQHQHMHGSYMPDHRRMHNNGNQPVVDMKSLQYALDSVEAGTGQIRQILNASTFRPRLPGLTKIMSRFTRDNKWQKAQEVFDALQDLRIKPDTTIANAAISACDKGGQWEKALQIFKNMEVWGLDRDAITYSAVISALAKGRQWTVAIEVFHHMCSSGIEADAVTCCSLITALDKGGQWQLAEQVFIHMYAGDPRFHKLLQLEDDHSSLLATQQLVKQLTDRNSDLSKLVEEQSALIAQESMGSQDASNAVDLASKNSASNALLAALHIDASNKGLVSIAENEQQSPPPLPPNSTPTEQDATGNMAAVAAAVLGGGNNAPEGELNQIASQLSGGKFVSGQESFDLSNLRSALSREAQQLQQSPLQGSNASQLFGQHSLPVGADIQSLLNTTHRQGTDNATSISSLFPTSSLTPGHNFGPMSKLQRMMSDVTTYEMLRHSGGIIRKDSISTKKAAPNRVCCNALLAAYSRAKPPQWRKALKLLELMWECGNEVIPDIVSYNTVMKACSNASQLETALQVYYLMKQRRLEPSVATYGTLISAASEVQAYDTVMMIWRELRASGLEVNTTCMNALIHALEQQDRWEEAWQHFRAMLDGNSKIPASALTFNIMMSACVRRGEAQKVKELFNTMFQLNVQPTIQSYNTLLSAYALTGQWKEALDVLKFVSRPDVNVRPSVVSYNCVLQAIDKASEEANVQDKDVMAVAAIQVVEQARSMAGCEPNVGLYNSLMMVMNSTGKYPQALQAYEQMASKGVKPDSTTAAAILTSCSKDDNLWEVSIALFNKLKTLGIEPDCVVYNVSVTACARGGAWQQALQIFSEMMTGDFTVDPVTLQTIMKGLRDAEQWELLSKVFDLLRVNKAALNTNVYNMVLSAYEICGDYDKGTEVLRELLEAGLAPDHATMNSLLSLLTKSNNNWPKAMEAFEWMLEGCGDYKVYPTSETYVIMIEGLVSQKQFSSAIDFCVKGHGSNILQYYAYSKDNVNQISTINLNDVTPKMIVVLLNSWIDTIATLKTDKDTILVGMEQVHIYTKGQQAREAVIAVLEGNSKRILEVEEPVANILEDKKVEYEVDGNEEIVFSIDTEKFYAWIQK